MTIHSGLVGRLSCGKLLADCPELTGSGMCYSRPVGEGNDGWECMYYGFYLDQQVEEMEKKLEKNMRSAIPALLLVELDKIVGSSIQYFTTVILAAIPEQTWRRPSSRDHHLVDERGEWGNLLHTVRVTRIASDLADALNLDQQKKDILRSASLIHDCCKFGVDGTLGYITPVHPQLAASFVNTIFREESYPPPSTIIDCIIQHMGRWGSVPVDWGVDKITLPLLLHLADCVEARLVNVIISGEIR